MNSIMKLSFVALLTGVVLSLPVKVRSQSGSYTCTSQFPACEQGAEQSLNQCMYDCGTGGSGSTTCDLTQYADCYNNGDGTYTCYQSYYTDCHNTNGCQTSCIDQFNSQFGVCLSEYCHQ